ncbi:MAG: CHAT domain-containing protein [Leptolyngbya sp. SIOISBB]|nr:CHAT domain-containing protein [Leptolyngbya sp. SIOISBB]
MPGAAAEAIAIANEFGVSSDGDGSILIGSMATEGRVRQSLPSARIIHLATHGLLEYGDLQASAISDIPGAIALTPDTTHDGLLTAEELLKFDLTADLVVLSACDTGLGTLSGDGVIGLSRSLIAAGAPSVVVSLWAIPDNPTADLMIEFYSQLKQGQDKASALRLAMLERMKYSDPSAWGAFTLIGEADW